MSLSAQQYNRLRGPALTVLIMDKVRHHSMEGQELNTRKLTMQLAREAQVQDRHLLNALYHRVRVVVRNLADAGLITTTRTFHRTNGVNVTIITLPCSASTAK